jgi:hypothetical protein
MWLLLGGCAVEPGAEGAAPGAGESVGVVEQAACGSATGDWSGFPQGDGTLQCVGGVRQFYANHFNAYVPPASGGPVGNCAKYGACDYWVDPSDRPDPANWTRYDWGSTPAQTYDMVVFPPTSGNAYGHVASVDHMEGNTLFVMDANWSPWKGHKAACVHDVGSYKPYGFYRLKSLDQPQTCDRSAGGFTFSCDGPQTGQTCVNVNEPQDPDSWSDNYLCSAQDLGMKWSASGPIAGMDCTGVTEAADPQSTAWSDDFLCLPPESPYIFSWSSAGPVAGQTCVQWNEPGDTHSWGDNYLCFTARSAFTSPPFTFSGSGAIAGQTCVSVNEPSDPDTWSDNYLCSDGDFGLKWSDNQPIAGLTCTNVLEPADPQAAAWADNYFCAPPQTPWAFSWSGAGPIAGKSCVRWYEAADLAGTWNDNWLCFDPIRDFSAGGFTFRGDGPEAGQSCVALGEPDDAAWSDNYFCNDQEIALKWSTSGPIDGMACTQVTEPDEAKGWKDDYLCVPRSAPVRFTWSSTGAIEGETCVRWFDHDKAPRPWADNWMCLHSVTPEADPGGSGGASGSSSGGAAGHASGGAAGAHGGAAGASAGGNAGQGKAGGPGGHASGTAGAAGSEASSLGEEPFAATSDSSSEGSCATGRGGRPSGSLSLLLALAGAAAARLRSRRR